MKQNLLYFFITASLLSAVIINSLFVTKSSSKEEQTPNDWFFLQRAFPYQEINYEARQLAWTRSQELRAECPERGEGWVFKGPLNIGGRISAVAMHPADMQTIYAGAASGGIFKSVDAGGSWVPVFEDALSLSIGDIAIAPSDPSIVWAGTGEPNAGGGSMTYDGFGIYKSGDAGSSWEHLGLENSGSIGRLVVHPSDPQTCFVAAMGRLFSNNPERGVFRTTDGGISWEKVLFVNDSVGAVDIVMHPEHPDTLYAAMWERVRRPDKRIYGGQGSGIYRSYDGGDTWVELAGGLPPSSPYIGRIGIDISASDPEVLYAIYADDIGYFAGLYKTENNGNTWTRTNDGSLSDMYASYGWWFGRISIDPVNPDIAFAIGFDLYRTSNGGDSWGMISSSVHVDQHDLVAHPLNHNFVVLGNDGGIYLSYNGGSTWNFLQNLPITQFYTCEADEQNPQRLYGGTQDNGTNRTLMLGSGWESIYWGDGFYVLVDPTDNDYIYAEYQYGNFARSTDGGYSFYSAMSGISGSDRMNWNTPFVLDPNNPQILFYGANRLYKTTNRAASWQVISPDLTNGGGGVNAVYGTITSISVSPANSQFIYAGTDDGNVWRTGNGGNTWVEISAGLPLRWVTRVAADPYDENTVYVTLSGYRYNNYLPHVFRSANGGSGWQDITGNLPDAPANDIIVDPLLDSTLYLATDFGVFITRNLGQDWSMLGDDLPNVPIVDLDFHQPTRMLIAATYGRSMYTFDLDQLVNITDDLPGAIEVNLKYPNPFNIKYPVTIEGAEGKDYTLIISLLNGQRVSIMNIRSNTQVFIPQNLATGLYLISVSDASGVLKSEKILIMR
jgi:photosystem II stability/assembly factor-like uncharacterized protein